jgi:hypothetical protein
VAAGPSTRTFHQTQALASSTFPYPPPPFLASATVSVPTPYSYWSPLERMTRTGCYSLLQVGVDCVCDEEQI